ncbi:MAG TPA: M28 family peptidase, partial [Verrucomicrobiae bacterium]|nr:M28 family peptidase [Verrucomicrobiae bacterium]
MRLIHSTDSVAGICLAEIQAGLSSVSEARLRKWVEMISIPRHFKAQRQDNEATARWIGTLLKDWGYEVQLQGPYNNVVALPREQVSGEITLVGAHYDSVPGTPGADDNGSAVAALLGCAEALARIVPGAAVGFVAFNCEEDGMTG